MGMMDRALSPSGDAINKNQPTGEKGTHLIRIL